MDSFSSLGITSVRSCIMINALMNGSMPSEKSVAFCKEPPVIVDRMLRKSSASKESNTLLFSPGTGI